MPPVKMKGDGRKAKNPKQTISRLLSYMAKYKATMAVVVICIIFTVVTKSLEAVKRRVLRWQIGVKA